MMRNSMVYTMITATVGLVLIGTESVWAQLSPSELAERIDEANAEAIREIDHITITSEMTDGLAKGQITTVRFEKVEKAGRPVLQAVREDELGPMPLSGVHDGMLADMVRHGESVERGRHEGAAVYIVRVNDPAYLRSMGELDESMPDEQFAPKQASIWLDAGDLKPLRAEFIQDGPTGGEMNVTMVMDEYRTYRGLPVAHRMHMSISGIESVMPAAEMQEARSQMKQLMEQLEQMPAEQRAMIESQLAPQMEQFEQVMSSGATTMEVRVTDVSFD